MSSIPPIVLYGSEGCAKTHYYQLIFERLDLPFTFLEVEENEENAEALRKLYENGKLNYPTITIGSKKLRNPKREELERWINKLIPSRLPIEHQPEQQQFVLAINEEIAKITYSQKGNTLYLEHSEVPAQLRGRGIGQVLVQKTLEQIQKEGLQTVAVCPFIQKVAAQK